MSYTIAELIREAERELHQRERLYPNLVMLGRMPRKTADKQLALQRAIIERLREDDARERLL
jgi:hypothetical protein